MTLVPQAHDIKPPGLSTLDSLLAHLLGLASDSAFIGAWDGDWHVSGADVTAGVEDG